ncbi:N-acetyltransferase [Spirochaetia bacterium]|nr:N-acetyltransferase [Spirochaetia bacterium]
MLIRYAEITDFGWLIEHDKHISNEILKVKIKNKEIYIIQEENKIIGWLRYSLFWDNIPFMNLLFVLEEYQNKGYGKKLVKYWEEKMKRNGYNNVLTSTQSNENAQHFYRKIGYIEIGGLKYLDDPYEIIFYKNIK